MLFDSQTCQACACRALLTDLSRMLYVHALHTHHRGIHPWCFECFRTLQFLYGNDLTEILSIYFFSLTLGAHAQRGLRYLVSVSVCVSVTSFSATTRYNAHNKTYVLSASAGHEKGFKFGVFFKILRSGIMA